MKKIIAPLLLIFLSALLTVIWFHKGLMFGGGEEGLPFYNLSNHLRSMSYVWNESQAGFDMVIFLPRIPYFWVLEKLFTLGISSVFLQALTFFTLISTGCLSVYFLIKETVTDGLTPFLSSIFYLFNPFSMVQIWGRGIYAQFFAFTLIPLFLLLYILGIKRKNLIYIILCIIVSIVFSPAFVFPTQILVLWIPVILYSVFHAWINRRSKREIIFTMGFLVFLGVFWLLAQAWWFWPYIRTLGASVSKLGDIEYNLGSLRGISRDSSFDVVIRLIHKFQLAGMYGNTYLSFPFRLISWLIPLMILFSINTFKKLKYFRFYLGLLFMSLFIVMGTNPPLGFVFEWLFRNISPFQGFRNPYEKAGILLLISMKIILCL